MEIVVLDDLKWKIFIIISSMVAPFPPRIFFISTGLPAEMLTYLCNRHFKHHFKVRILDI